MSTPWMPFGAPGPDAVLISEVRFRTMKDLLIWVSDKLAPYALPEDKGDFRETLKRVLGMPRTASLEAFARKLEPFHRGNESVIATLDRVLEDLSRYTTSHSIASLNLDSFRRRDDMALKVIGEQREQIRLLRKELNLSEARADKLQSSLCASSHHEKTAPKRTPKKKENRK